MFFRKKTTPSGLVLQLIQSFRNKENKPRQRIIVSLGDAAIPEPDQPLIARRVEHLLSGQKELVPNELSPAQVHWVDRILRQIQLQGVRALNEVLDTPVSNTPVPVTPAARPATPKPAPDGKTLPVTTLDKIEHSHATSAGPELLGLHAWNALGLSQALVKLGLNDAQIRCAQATVINRMVEPVSEHALGPWLENVSSLPDLLGESFHGKHIEGRFHRVADLLHKNQSALETHLREQQEQLFGRRPTIYLYDLTNTYFEGRAAGNPEAKHGHSKEKRSDCPLVSLALAYSQDGLPLGHKVFAGNQNDATSFPEVLARLQADWKDLCAKDQRPLFVMDCGIGTAPNLLLLRQSGYDYLVSERRSTRAEYESFFASLEGFSEITGKGVLVKMQRTPMPPDPPLAPPAADAAENATTPTSPAAAAAPAAQAAQLSVAEPAAVDADKSIETLDKNGLDQKETGWEETKLFCLSPTRAEKENAMLTKARARLEADLEKLKRRVASGNLTAPEEVNQCIGRLRERHSSVARYYKITPRLQSVPPPALLPPPPAEATTQTPGEPAPAPGRALKVPPRKTRTGGKPKRPLVNAIKDVFVSELQWEVKPDAAPEKLCGAYSLSSNRGFSDGAAMWGLYTDLTNAEDGFRCLKSDLGLRPVHHQKKDRVQAHIFISVIALHLLCFIKKRLAEAGEPCRTWTTIKTLMRSHAYATLTVTTAEATHHLRKPGRPNLEQNNIYKCLGIDLAACPKTHIRLPHPNN
jgi:transposase